MTFGATLKAGQKTSKTVDLFVSEALIAEIHTQSTIFDLSALKKQLFIFYLYLLNVRKI
jgi:hypothetical protein